MFVIPIYSTYTLSAKKEDHPEVALEEFKKIVSTEEEKGDWYFINTYSGYQLFKVNLFRIGDSKH